MIEIRNAKSEDVSAVYALGERVDEFHTSDQAPMFWPKAVLRTCIDKDDVYFLVAISGEEIVGFIIVNLNKNLSKALIENIFVKPNFRGRGIGLSLTERAVSLAKLDRYQFISVLTPPDDIAAIKTYERAGFSKGETFLWLDVA